MLFRSDVTLFEANNYVGGHSNTKELPCGTPVDTGFIVLNDWTYPNLIKLFDALNVPVAATDMSFAVSANAGGFEYGGGSLRALFAQKRNWLRPRFWRMIFGIKRFYKHAPQWLQQNPASELSLGDFLQQFNYHPSFVADHLVPMGAAIWSVPQAQMLQFPMRSFVQFCQNHGLLLFTGRPQWRTVVGGSLQYVVRLTANFASNIKLNTPVLNVVGQNLTTHLGTQEFDKIIFACHANQALKILGDSATQAQQNILGAFGYSQNVAYLHHDEKLMPKTKATWSAWNYLAQNTKNLVLTYWMNLLQPLKTLLPTFVTLNPKSVPNKVVATINYQHPQFNQAAWAAQQQLHTIQSAPHYFCGAYCGYGFHEDGLTAGLTVAEIISGQPRPWVVVEKSCAKAHLLSPQ